MPSEASAAYRFWLKEGGADTSDLDDRQLDQLVKDVRTRMAKFGPAGSVEDLRQQLVLGTGPVALSAYTRLPWLAKGGEAAWAVVLRQLIVAVLQGTAYREKYAAVLDDSQQFALFCDEMGDEYEAPKAKSPGFCIGWEQLRSYLRGLVFRAAEGFLLWWRWLVALLLVGAFLLVAIDRARQLFWGLDSDAFVTIDANHDGIVELGEFLTAAKLCRPPLTELQAKYAFRGLDADQDGRLSSLELGSAKLEGFMASLGNLTTVRASAVGSSASGGEEPSAPLMAEGEDMVLGIAAAIAARTTVMRTTTTTTATTTAAPTTTKTTTSTTSAKLVFAARASVTTDSAQLAPHSPEADDGFQLGGLFLAAATIGILLSSLWCLMQKAGAWPPSPWERLPWSRGSGALKMVPTKDLFSDGEDASRSSALRRSSLFFVALFPFAAPWLTTHRSSSEVQSRAVVHEPFTFPGSVYTYDPSLTH